jgi:Family of unknown function (DUF6157)
MNTTARITPDRRSQMLEIVNTFIKVAPDSTATTAVIPEARDDKKTIQVIQYESLTAQPYSLTLQDLIFEVFVQRNQISSADLELHKTTIWKELFAKDHPCMRASMLPKKYGWGVHYDAAGKIGLHKVESESYQQLAAFGQGVQKVEFAMRSKRV